MVCATASSLPMHVRICAAQQGSGGQQEVSRLPPMCGTRTQKQGATQGTNLMLFFGPHHLTTQLACTTLLLKVLLKEGSILYVYFNSPSLDFCIQCRLASLPTSQRLLKPKGFSLPTRLDMGSPLDLAWIPVFLSTNALCTLIPIYCIRC
jgi:hypothetical protein